VQSIEDITRSVYERLKTGDPSVEERRLDIKREWHHANTSKAKDLVREEFCKDVCALANSSYPSEGYLLFGLQASPPYAIDAPLPMDEASLQQQLAAGISPPPRVRIVMVSCGGAQLCALEVSPSRRSLPYVARYKNNLWIPWVRQGSSTRCASHLDLVSMFDLRREAESRALPRLNLLDAIWSGNWSISTTHWKPQVGRLEGGSANPGLQCHLRLINAGTLPTALFELSATLRWSDGQEVSSANCLSPSWPIPVQQRAGDDTNTIFFFDEKFPAPCREASSLMIRAKDLDEGIHEFNFPEARIRET
jgi:Putative DNA-binding domain